jgi:hypothetical protein
MNTPEWVYRGKSIEKLIMELKTIENQQLEVRISVDDGENHKPISLVTKDGDFCILVFSK